MVAMLGMIIYSTPSCPNPKHDSLGGIWWNLVRCGIIGTNQITSTALLRILGYMMIYEHSSPLMVGFLHTHTSGQEKAICGQSNFHQVQQKASVMMRLLTALHLETYPSIYIYIYTWNRLRTNHEKSTGSPDQLRGKTMVSTEHFSLNQCLEHQPSRHIPNYQ